MLLHTVLSNNQALVVQYDTFVRSWVDQEMNLMPLLETPEDCALALRHTQIRISTWLNEQVLSASTVEPPRFTELIHGILLRQQWRPLSAGPNIPAPRTPATPTPTPPVRGTPPAAPPVTPSPAPAPAPSARERVANVQHKPVFSEFKNLGIPLRTVREAAAAANKPVPKNAKGTEYCLSWHVGGFCFTNCGRKEDHREHTGDEHNRLLTWCRECYRQGGPQ